VVRIRLTRLGRRNRPFYRIVVVDSRKRRDGAYIESLGYYDPVKDPAEMKLNVERTLEWLLKGAQPSETVRNIFKKFGVMKRRRRRKMKEVLEHILKGIVKHPEDLVVMEFEEEGKKVFEIIVNEEDVGQVIGKDGRTIKSIKIILSSLSDGTEEFTLRVVR